MILLSMFVGMTAGLGLTVVLLALVEFFTRGG